MVFFIAALAFTFVPAMAPFYGSIIVAYKKHHLPAEIYVQVFFFLFLSADHGIF